MQESNIVLIDFPQADGGSKVRPALILKHLPKYQDFLVCGISTQIHQLIKDFDIIINEGDRYFDKTGLHKTSIIRLFFWQLFLLKIFPEALGKYHTTCIKSYWSGSQCFSLLSFIPLL